MSTVSENGLSAPAFSEVDIVGPKKVKISFQLFDPRSFW